MGHQLDVKYTTCRDHVMINSQELLIRKQLFDKFITAPQDIFKN